VHPYKQKTPEKESFSVGDLFLKTVSHYTMIIFIMGILSLVSQPLFAQNDIHLVTVGTGIRTRIGMKIYKASLALPRSLKNEQDEAIVKCNMPMVITVTILSSFISKRRFLSAVDEAFDTAEHMGFPTCDRERYKAFFTDAAFSKGEIFVHKYEPGKGLSVTRVTLTDSQCLGTIPGLAFKQSFFSLFLGPRPVQESLKRELMGQP
jgi:hypothetical protein